MDEYAARPGGHFACGPVYRLCRIRGSTAALAAPASSSSLSSSAAKADATACGSVVGDATRE